MRLSVVSVLLVRVLAYGVLVCDYCVAVSAECFICRIACPHYVCV